MAAPYTLFLMGGIASGKSTVARTLSERGARRIDLDAISAELLRPGSPILDDVLEAFGSDLANPETGMLNRAGLAQRAFASPESAALLEAIEIPAILSRLGDILLECGCAADAPVLCVVEVPLPNKMGDSLNLADELAAVICPRELRRARALARGMDGADFDARDALQPSEEELRVLADTVFVNDTDHEGLIGQINSWWVERERSGWKASR